MIAYLVRIPELRTAYSTYEPPEPWYAAGIFVAETAAQAKRDALLEWAGTRSSGVYHDDWTALRVSLLARDVPLGRGELTNSRDPLYRALWFRASEVLDAAEAARG